MARSSPPAPCPIPLVRLAETVHVAATPFDRSLVASVEVGPTDVAFGTWPVPAAAPHPADPLVGFLAPAPWEAIGLVSTGRLVDLAGGADPPRRLAEGPARERSRVVVTVVADRSGGFASVVDRPSSDLQLLEDPPEGWVADVLARALGRSTPPPTDRLSRVVEGHWLDAIARLVLHQPGQVRTWTRLARLHPLAPEGPACPGTVLAERSEALDLESSWARMRRFFADRPPPDAPAHPPGGRQVPLSQWFDDGSFSRWIQRNLPPLDSLLAAVLDAVPATVGAELVDALVAVSRPAEGP